MNLLMEEIEVVDSLDAYSAGEAAGIVAGLATLAGIGYVAVKAGAVIIAVAT
jgi:hypothetical protein